MNGSAIMSAPHDSESFDPRPAWLKTQEKCQDNPGEWYAHGEPKPATDRGRRAAWSLASWIRNANRGNWAKANYDADVHKNKDGTWQVWVRLVR